MIEGARVTDAAGWMVEGIIETLPQADPLLVILAGFGVMALTGSLVFVVWQRRITSSAYLLSVIAAFILLVTSMVKFSIGCGTEQ